MRICRNLFSWLSWPDLSGGSGRDKTNGLIVVNDGVRRTVPLTGFGLAAEFGSLRFNSNQLALELPQLQRERSYTVDIFRDDTFATAAVSKV